MPPDGSSRPGTARITAADSRALVRAVGPTAWAVLVDVVLDARPEDGAWSATTSVRQIADHLGLTPGTAARALSRLGAAGLVRRRDRRDGVTGRFVESLYVIVPSPPVRPCVDCPHTAEPHMAGAAVAVTGTADRAAGQRLPEGMASVVDR